MQAAYTTLALAIIVGSSVPVMAAPFWQRPKAQPPAQQQAAPSKSLVGSPQSTPPNAAPKTHMLGPGPHNGDWLRKYGSLPQAEQEKQLESDPVFQSLAPEKKQRLINRLHFFNSLSPAKKQQVLNRMETYEHLSPEKQKEADNLYVSYRALPADQQSQVSQAYRKIRQMTPEQRSEFLSSDEFQSGYNEQQKTLLKGLSELYPNPAK